MDPNDWLMGGGKTVGISWRNKPVGTSVTGTVCRESKMMQQKDPESDELLWWDDKQTQPKMQLVVYLQTAERDSSIEDDDGVRALYIKGKSLTEGMREAVKKSGRKGIEVGGTVTVTYVGEGQHTDPRKAKVYNPPKLYRVEYRPPADSASTSFLAEPAASSAAPASQGNGQAPASLDPAAWAALDPARRAEILASMQAAGPAAF
jgi:hypothetical protein